MAQAEHFDALVLGSGQGGKQLAWHLARSGQRVAVVERRYVGGSCPNIACMPSKNEIWGARIAYLARHVADFGAITGPVTTDIQISQQCLVGGHRAVNRGGETRIQGEICDRCVVNLHDLMDSA